MNKTPDTISSDITSDDTLDIIKRIALWLLPTVGTHEQIQIFSTVGITIVAILFIRCKEQAAYGGV